MAPGFAPERAGIDGDVGWEVMPWTWPHSIVPRALRKLARLALPARLEWALEYFLYYHDPGCEPELWHLPSICAGPGVAIDVGANIGYYTYPLSRMFDAVYAFEINPELTRAIETWGPGNVEIIDSGLSSGSGEATLYIPVHRGLPLTGWASLEPGNCPDTDEHLELAVRIDTLDAHGFERVDFMKIDVEGHELNSLRCTWITPTH